MNFDTGIYNVADDEPVKGSDMVFKRSWCGS